MIKKYHLFSNFIQKSLFFYIFLNFLFKEIISLLLSYFIFKKLFILLIFCTQNQNIFLSFYQSYIIKIIPIINNIISILFFWYISPIFKKILSLKCFIPKTLIIILLSFFIYFFLTLFIFFIVVNITIVSLNFCYICLSFSKYF